MDKAYCSNNETLKLCDTCLRNDMHRIEATVKGKKVHLVVAKPKGKNESERCDMYLTTLNELMKANK